MRVRIAERCRIEGSAVSQEGGSGCFPSSDPRSSASTWGHPIMPAAWWAPNDFRHFTWRGSGRGPGRRGRPIHVQRVALSAGMALRDGRRSRRTAGYCRRMDGRCETRQPPRRHGGGHRFRRCRRRGDGSEGNGRRPHLTRWQPTVRAAHPRAPSGAAASGSAAINRGRHATFMTLGNGLHMTEQRWTYELQTLQGGQRAHDFQRRFRGYPRHDAGSRCSRGGRCTGSACARPSSTERASGRGAGRRRPALRRGRRRLSLRRWRGRRPSPEQGLRRRAERRGPYAISPRPGRSSELGGAHRIDTGSAASRSRGCVPGQNGGLILRSRR